MITIEQMRAGFQRIYDMMGDISIDVPQVIKNKYAIHAYTHGPVTGSGPSVKPLKYVTLLLVAS